MKTKVIVAMSGGVDSSVAAALLAEKGYEVTGIMLKLWTGDCEQKENACCTPESIAQAKSVANQLGIPFYVLDAKNEFKNNVVDDFISGYQGGLTPNPCFICNQTIKWGYLLNKALQTGADYLATGHYAQILKDNNNISHLYKGLDEKKDQSYVLAGLSQEQLSHTLLPLGEMHKEKVRELATKYGFAVADKPDSQDLCFIGKNGYRSFLEQYGAVMPRPGIIRNENGEAVGEHQGLFNYTIGQRKGLGSGHGVPQFVIEKNIEKNELIIGPAEQLGTRIVNTRVINWISQKPSDDQQEFEVKIRYKSIPVRCRIKLLGKNDIRIILDKPIRDATPGQIAVLYNQNEVLGSGLILSTEREN